MKDYRINTVNIVKDNTLVVINYMYGGYVYTEYINIVDLIKLGIAKKEYRKQRSTK